MWTGFGSNVHVRIDDKVTDASAQKAEAYCQVYDATTRAKSPPSVPLLRAVQNDEGEWFVHNITDTVRVVTPTRLRTTDEAVPFLRAAISPTQAFHILRPKPERKALVVTTEHRKWHSFTLPAQAAQAKCVEVIVQSDTAEEDGDTNIQIRLGKTLCTWRRGAGNRQTMVFDYTPKQLLHVCVDASRKRNVCYNVEVAASAASYVFECAARVDDDCMDCSC